jgi:hypothetical protein
MRPTIFLIILALLSGPAIAAQESVTITSGAQDLSRPISSLLHQLRQREQSVVET